MSYREQNQFEEVIDFVAYSCWVRLSDQEGSIVAKQFPNSIEHRQRLFLVQVHHRPEQHHETELMFSHGDVSDIAKAAAGRFQKATRGFWVRIDNNDCIFRASKT